MHDSITKIEDGNYIIRYPNKNNKKKINIKFEKKIYKIMDYDT